VSILQYANDGKANEMENLYKHIFGFESGSLPFRQLGLREAGFLAIG
jgi:hypothetical protein